MNILKKLRKDAAVQSIMVIVLGLMMITGGLFTALRPDTPARDLNEMAFDELKEDKFVALNRYVLLYEYAYQDDGDISYSFFVIGSVNKYNEQILLTLMVTEAERDRLVEYAETHLDESWFENQFYHGTLNTMSKSLKELYDKALLDLEMEPINLVSYLYIDGIPGIYVPDDTANQFAGVFLIVMGLLVSIWGLLMIFGFGQRSAMKIAAKLDLSGSAKQYLESFERRAQEYHGVYLSNDAILFNQGIITQLIPLNDFIWAYTTVFERKLYFIIKISTVYSIMLRTSNKRPYQLVFKKQKQAEEVLSALMSRSPDLIVTEFSYKLQKEFKKNPMNFAETIRNLGYDNLNK